MRNTTGKTKEPFAFQAAKFSWIAPLISLAIGFFGNAARDDNKYGPGDSIEMTDRIVSFVVAGTSLLLLIFGFVFAIIALFSMKLHGKHGIMGHAITGLILNTLFLGLFMLGVLLAIMA